MLSLVYRVKGRGLAHSLSSPLLSPHGYAYACKELRGFKTHLLAYRLHALAVLV